MARVKDVTGGRGVDVVYDGVGRDTFARSLDCLARRGMLVSFGNASGPPAPLDPLLLSRKGSLFLTRPTLHDYTATREERLACAGGALRGDPPRRGEGRGAPDLAAPGRRRGPPRPRVPPHDRLLRPPPLKTTPGGTPWRPAPRARVRAGGRGGVGSRREDRPWVVASRSLSRSCPDWRGRGGGRAEDAECPWDGAAVPGAVGEGRGARAGGGWVNPGPLGGRGFESTSGIRRDDNVVSVNGKAVDAAGFKALVTALAPGDEVTLVYRRSPAAESGEARSRRAGKEGRSGP